MKLQKKITILFFYLIFIIYSLEILTKIFIKNNEDLITTNMDELRKIEITKIKDFDVRNDYEAFEEEKKTRDIHPSFRLSINTINKNDEISKFLKHKILKKNKIPFRGPINKLSLGDNEDGIREIISNDKYGFKNLNEVYQKEIDAMIVGDSFAEGIPFDNENSVSGLININSKFNSINYGVSGTGPLNSLGVISEYGKYFKPKKVFYFFYEGNDLYDLLEEKETFLINYLERSYSQNVYKSNEQIENFLNEYENIFYKILPMMIKKNKNKNTIDIDININNQHRLVEHLKDIAELQNLKRVLIPKDAYYSKDKKLDHLLFEKSILEMKNRVNSWEGEFYLVFLPSWTRYNNFFSLSDKYKKRHIIKIVENNNLKFIDMDKIFRNNQMDTLNLFNLGIYGHYNKKGYKLIADTIIKKLL